MHNDINDTITGLQVIWWVCYFIPAGVALVRRHHNRIAIAILNALLGWTVIGWIVALIWAATAVPRRQPT